MKQADEHVNDIHAQIAKIAKIAKIAYPTAPFPKHEIEPPGDGENQDEEELEDDNVFVDFL